MPKRDGLRTELRTMGHLTKSKPGWEDRILDKVFSRKLARANHDLKWGRELNVTAGKTLKAAVGEAAEKRGMSRTSYMRRAIAAFVAHDLGTTPAKLLEDGPRAAPSGTTLPPKDAPPEDGVTGFGPWKIGSLSE